MIGSTEDWPVCIVWTMDLSAFIASCEVTSRAGMSGRFSLETVWSSPLAKLEARAVSTSPIRTSPMPRRRAAGKAALVYDVLALEVLVLGELNGGGSGGLVAYGVASGL